SFVGRPFPLDDADSHFRRLSKAGFTFLRLIITWEALEHAGPGLYDEAYLAYLRKILLAAEENGISVFMDPHQDVWSRWTGGDGAPAWTLEKLGIDLDTIDMTESAVTRQRYGEFHTSKKHPEGDPYPRMIWPGNYNRYATATMFSLFFGGKTFAPSVCIDGENVQDFLQRRYIDAFRHCYRRLKNCKALAGWGIMNEPHNGFIGLKNLALAETAMVPIGPRPSPWDTILSASGYTVEVPEYSAMSMGKYSTGKAVFNPTKTPIFREGFTCPWKQAGVWTDSGNEPRLLKNDHFANKDNRQANFLEDFHKPFMFSFIERMKEADEKTFFFIEGLPNGIHHEWGTNDPPNAINAFHWYDGFALFTKTFRPWFTMNPGNSRFIFGGKNVQKHFKQVLAESVEWSRTKMGNMPCLLGEFGLAFDMNKRKAFKNGNYSLHEEALSMYYNAVDANLLHSTIWNYTADNTNATGDGWNEEDLSIFSEGKERARAGWKRPYPMATAGQLRSFSWDRKKRIFCYAFTADNAITAPGIIFLPNEWFGQNPEIICPLRHEYEYDEQRLLVWNDDFNGEAEVRVIGK
ncbi:MAG: cellulase family glycosylhydrolase, partial [Treponema sp.]|nr:cellulase family glycosylhydrolase [Treponema sp.]